MSVERAVIPEQPKLKRLVSRAVQNLGPLLALILLCIIAAFATPVFVQPRNILNVLRQSSINAIIAAGMTLTILTAGIDLSVGSVVALASTAMGLLMIHHGVASSVAICLALILAAFVGGHQRAGDYEDERAAVYCDAGHDEHRTGCRAGNDARLPDVRAHPGFPLDGRG